MGTQFEVGAKVNLQINGRPDDVFGESVGVVTCVIPQGYHEKVSGGVTWVETQEVWVKWPAEIYGRPIEVNYWAEDLVIVNECEEQE